MEKKYKIAIKVDKKGNILDHKPAPDGIIPSGWDDVIEIEHGQIISSFGAISGYKYQNGKLVTKEQKEIIKEVNNIRYKKERKNSYSINDPIQLKENFFSDLKNILGKSKELIILTFLLALTISFFSTSVFQIIIEYEIKFLILSVVFFILSLIIIFIYFNREYKKRTVMLRTATAIVFHQKNKRIPLPLKIKLKPRLSKIETPFIIEVKKIFYALNTYDKEKIEDIKIGNLTFLLYILSKINKNSLFPSTSQKIFSFDIGPFSDSSQIKKLDYYPVIVDNIFINSSDKKLVQECMPYLKMIYLPLGVKLKVSLLFEESPYISFESQFIKLRIQPTMGSCTFLSLSEWDIDFTIPSQELLVLSTILTTKIEYGGLLRTLVKSIKRKGRWPYTDYLTWFFDTIAYIHSKLFWIIDTSAIPDSELYLLKDEQKVQYEKYLKDTKSINSISFIDINST